MNIAIPTNKIAFEGVVVDGTHYDHYAYDCPSCGKEHEISGDAKNEADREGELTPPCNSSNGDSSFRLQI